MLETFILKKINNKLNIMIRIKNWKLFNESVEERTDDKVGKEFWFEYHCFESPKSCDAEIWYRSHQKVKVDFV